jgi:hypothetical protein
MTKIYAVFGGHLPDPSTSGPKDIAEPEFVGLFTDKDAARSAWNGASYASVDDAHRRHFVKELDLPEAQAKELLSLPTKEALLPLEDLCGVRPWKNRVA